MLALITAVAPLLLLIFQEYFSMSAREREAGRVFVIDQDTLRLIVNSAMEKLIARNAKDSAGAGDAWDQADKEAKTPSPKDPGSKS